jgi:hypothetical protein
LRTNFPLTYYPTYHVLPRLCFLAKIKAIHPYCSNEQLMAIYVWRKSLSTRKMAKKSKMEAGRFESPSRDILGQASTYLVVHLNFTHDNAKRQALSLSISQSVSPLRHEHPQRLARCLTPFPDPQVWCQYSTCSSVYASVCNGKNRCPCRCWYNHSLQC